MPDADTIRRKILYDSPAVDDAFAGGGHRRTALSLARAIKEFDDETRAIGLEGKWGSGKSTILEIATGYLASENNDRTYNVFTFDLWANQTTSFRRAFLEGILSWLDGIADSDKGFVARMRDKIRDRVVDTRTTNTKIFSGFGLAVLGFLLLLPWIYMWISPFALSGNGFNTATIAAVMFIGLMLVATAIQTVMTYFASQRSSAPKKIDLDAGSFPNTVRILKGCRDYSHNAKYPRSRPISE